jgi:hypothetical protein
MANKIQTSARKTKGVADMFLNILVCFVSITVTGTPAVAQAFDPLWGYRDMSSRKEAFSLNSYHRHFNLSS